MNDLPSRLTEIFLALFPDLRESDIATANRNTVSAWDSVASVTLMTLVEEEFEVELDFDDAGEWASFDDVRAALEKKISS